MINFDDRTGKNKFVTPALHGEKVASTSLPNPFKPIKPKPLGSSPVKPTKDLDEDEFKTGR